MKPEDVKAGEMCPKDCPCIYPNEGCGAMVEGSPGPMCPFRDLRAVRARIADLSRDLKTTIDDYQEVIKHWDNRVNDLQSEVKKLNENLARAQLSQRMTKRALDAVLDV
jgi:hypothetical protein